MLLSYDIIVVGAGHAGCEAAHAAARLGCTTLLISLDLNKIAQMSCNPAVGGIAKGQIVREIDALGGMMGIVTDRSAIQFRMLNRSKGPAMWSPRSQCDRMKFSAEWRNILENTDGLYMWQDDVVDLDVADGAVCGVRTALGMHFTARAVVLTNGTFLNGLMHIGRTQLHGGRISEPASCGLTDALRLLGFATDRMKTGTPVRIDGRTVDFTQAVIQHGDDHDAEGGVDVHRFSYLPGVKRVLRQRPCYTVTTDESTHEVLRRGLPDSPLYNGQIQSIGPRYCPSIETKIVTFADKSSHQLFLEPEGETTHEYYLNGFSSSLPIDIQLEALQTIPALRNVQIYRPGYAIEYDFFDPTQLRHTLETKLVRNLYFAGQINGTTGYEEAAGQGLVAGINAALKLRGREPLTLSRDQAYIGVLIDDLVTKGVDEPYRMFTSRAEYRILLRQDNADVRLTPIGREIGLVDDARYAAFCAKQADCARLEQFLREFTARTAVLNPRLEAAGMSPLPQGQKLAHLLQRPDITLRMLIGMVEPLAELVNSIDECRRAEVVESVEIAIKYSGYLQRERDNAAKMHRLENVRLADDLDYMSLTQISTEGRQKLSRIRPGTVAQASRIPGVSPSDINILLLLLGR